MKSFGELSERGQARRLRPLALAALARYDLEVTGLRLISNGWNCVYRVDTTDGPQDIRVSRPIPAPHDRTHATENAPSASQNALKSSVVRTHKLSTVASIRIA